MNFLSLFVLIPLLMMLGLWIARDMKQIRTVAVIGSTILLALSVYTLVEFLAERAAGNTATMLFTDSRMWYAPFTMLWVWTECRWPCYCFLLLLYLPECSLLGR